MSESSIQQFLALVARVADGKTARSENDLSSKLAKVLESLGLCTVIDTSGSAGGNKRPDVLAYLTETDADLVLPSEVVIESKKPEEVTEFPCLADAITSERYWIEKTYPYLRDNIGRVQYFAFTSFAEFAVFAISSKIRDALVEAFRTGETVCPELREAIRREVLSFDLLDNGSGSRSAAAWQSWLHQNLHPSALTAPIITEGEES